MKIKKSAGILVFRRQNGKQEFLLVHPDGPYWKNKDDGFWSIPKGEIHDGEDIIETAKREFKEETSFDINGNFISLGSITQNNGKVIHCFAIEKDLETSKIRSNTCLIEWPPDSGRQIEILEIDRGEFFDFETAKRKINPAQIPFLEKVKRLQSIFD